MNKSKPAFFLLAVLLLLSGCASFRAYYNAYFNAETAFKKAESLKQKRLKKNPLDSIKVTSEEKIQLERAIEKASKVLELYGHKPNPYLAKSLFMIGEAYLKIGEYEKAVKKYDELEKSFPEFEKMEIARFHRAICRFNGDNYPVAKRALLKFISDTKNQSFKLEAMRLFAELEQKNNSDVKGLEAYQIMLGENGIMPKTKGIIHFECARLAFSLEKYEQARENALVPEISLLTPDLRFKAKFIASRSLYLKGEKTDAIRELESLLKTEEFYKFKPEMHLTLGIWYMEAGREEEAYEFFNKIVKVRPKSSIAAEALYRMGEHTLDVKKNEKKAIDYFTASSECGDSLQYAKMSQEKAFSLKKLHKLRKRNSIDSLGLIKDFYMAELFLFNLNNIDSAVSHINKVVNSDSADSASSIKAAYARAFIYDEFVPSKEKSDSLYEYVIKRYPNTEYAKQAEINMGKIPATITNEDKAHKLFLEAEELYFGGFDYDEKVVPAYRAVVDSFPETRYAAKAQFVIAMLREFQYYRGDPAALFLAKKAHAKLSNDYSDTEYFAISSAKLQAAGIIKGEEIIDSLPPKSGDDVKDVHSDMDEYDDYDDMDYEDDDDPFYEEKGDSPETLERDGE